MALTTDLRGNKIEIANFVVGGSPWLQQVEISSQCDHSLSVSLRSDLGDMLAFQSENPNADRSELEHCNQMFNEVNLIQAIQIPAQGTVSVVVQFNPLRGNLKQLMLKSGENDGRHGQHKFFSVRGRVQLIGTAAGHETVKLPLGFRASVCHSVLRTDVHHLLFENCGLQGNNAQVRDFRVINCSEAPLQFLLAQRVGHCVLSAEQQDNNDEPAMSFIDYDTGVHLDTSHALALAGFAQKTIRVSYLPGEAVGEFKHEILVKNLSAEHNTQVIELHADVTLDERFSEVLQVTASSRQHELLDWGEGHIGLPVYETVNLRNISGDVQLIQMSSDRPLEVSFHFQPQQDFSSSSSSIVRAGSKQDIKSTPGRAPKEGAGRTIHKQASMDAGFDHHAPKASSFRRMREHTQSFGDLGQAREEENGTQAEQVQEPSTEFHKELAHQIDDLALLPGKHANIVVKYVPQLHDSNAADGAMSSRTFRITFRYSSDELKEQQPAHSQAKHGFSQSLKCCAKVCRTVVEVSPCEMLLGDCMLGKTRSGSFVVRNLSDMGTEVHVSHDSKVLSLSHESVLLAPKQTKEVSVVFAPTQKRGDYFNKEVWFRNLNNPDDNHVAHVRASVQNPDQSAVHSLFYKVTPRQLSFGSINTHSPTPCMMKLRNVSLSPIRVAISSSLPDELEVFAPRSALQELGSLASKPVLGPSSELLRSRSLTTKKQMLIEMVENRKERDWVAKHVSQEDVAASVAAGEDPVHMVDVLGTPGERAHPGSHRPEHVLPSTEKKSSLGKLARQRSYYEPESSEPEDSPRAVELNELLAVVREPIKWFFPDRSSEQEYIRDIIQHRKTLEEILHSNTFVAPQSAIQIPPGAEVELLLVLNANKTPISIDQGSQKAGQLQLLQTSLQVKLVEYDSSLIPGDGDLTQHSVQSILVESKVCCAVIDLVQKSINFGVVDVNDRKEAHISIGNSSDVPLMFRIIKTGKFASSSLEFPQGATGVVRAFGSVDVPLVFCPTFDGEFREAIRIESALAPSFSFKQIWVKALVRPKRTFWLERLQLRCGAVQANSKARTVPCRIVLTNTSRQRRTFCIQQSTHTSPSAGDIKCTVGFWLEHAGVARDVQKTEEDIEKLEQELKVSIRKNNDEKSQKIAKKLSSLKQQQLWEGGGQEEHSTGTGSQDGGLEGNPMQPQSDSITFCVNANTCQTILMGVRAHTPAGGTPMSPHEVVLGQLSVNEVRNVDDMRTIEFDVDVMRDCPEHPDPALIASPTMLPSAILSPADEMSPLVLSPADLRAQNHRVTLSPEEVELGEVNVGSRARASFSISNPGLQRIQWRILKTVLGVDQQQVDVLSFKPEHGELSPGGSVILKVACGPTVPGQQTHEAVVRSWPCDAEPLEPADHVIRFSMVAAHKEYLSFPSLRDQILDAGVLHIEPSSDTGNAWEDGQKVVPFQVKSMTHRTVLLTASTNMKRQAYVYADAALSQEVDRVQLQAYKGITLYFCLRPSSSQRRDKAKQLAENYKEGQCRELVGGVHFEVCSDEGMSLGGTTLKFTSLIGCSKLLVEPSRIDVCMIAAPGGTAQAKLTLRNSNSMIELPFEIHSSDPERLSVDTPKGVLSGSQCSPGDTVEVVCTMSNTELGLIHQSLIISNLNIAGSVGHKIVVPVSLFVDDGSMHSSTDSIELGLLYLDPHGPNQVAAQPLSLSISPSQSSSLLLQPLSDLPGLQLRGAGALSSTLSPRSPIRRSVDSIHGFVTCGQPIVANTAHSTELVAEFLASSGATPPCSDSEYLRHFTKQLVFYCTALQRVLKVVSVSGSLCVSHAELGSQAVDLGAIGYVSRYKDAPFEFQVCNRSAAPLSYRLEIPAGIVVEDLCGVVPPLESCTVHALVRTSMAQHQHGEAQWKLLVHNDNNSANTLEFLVHATVSACVLQYTGLSTAPDSQDRPAHALPSLKLTVGQHAEEGAVFEESMLIGNTLNDALDVIIHLSQPDEVIASLQLLSSEYNQAGHLEPLCSSRMEIGATEEVELQVRAQLGPGGAAALFGQQLSKIRPRRSSNTALETEKESAMVLLGELQITPVGHDMEVIPVFGTLCTESAAINPGSWSVSSSFMQLLVPCSVEQPPAQDTFLVHNLSASAALELELSVEGSILEEHSVQLNISPVLITLAPGQSAPVTVELHRHSELTQLLDGDGWAALILVSDTQQQASTKRIELSIHAQLRLESDDEPESSEAQIHQELAPVDFSAKGLSEEHPEPTVRPVMELRGCTPMDTAGQQYELDIGQRSCQTDSVNWELTLNLQPPADGQPMLEGSRARWSMAFAHPQMDNPWISLSADSGEIGCETTTIVVSFNTQYVGVYTAHVILNNHANPEDLKVVKVMMEVASHQPKTCLLYTSPSPRDRTRSRMPSSA
eukprot:TRINITY_DN18535_c0_g1_i6.p1 TRINITY_DN18535_c0_g1~~TRINITY_DN18535_c0_g1_i6.p1  ORF type:complete len:2392 (-),score=867.39 TRINITY_DN18535_c0_g1_i6:52-7227(-)